MTTSDLWDMDPQITSKGIIPKFENYLYPLMEKAINKSLESTPKISQNKSRQNSDSTEEKHSKGLISVLPAMVKLFGPNFFFGAILKIIIDG